MRSWQTPDSDNVPGSRGPLQQTKIAKDTFCGLVVHADSPATGGKKGYPKKRRDWCPWNSCKSTCWLCCLLVFACLSDLSRAAVQSRAFA